MHLHLGGFLNLATVHSARELTSNLTVGCLNATDHPEQVEAILSIATVKPHVVQNKFCPYSPGFQYDNRSAADPISYFTKLGIAFVSYSTLSGWPLHNSGAISPKDDPHVAAIATRLHHTPTQVLLRWALQHGAAVIPTSRTHAADNAAVFDFELDEGDMAAISYPL